jgi:glycosyltransferase involved in cell wall biosynthesis
LEDGAALNATVPSKLQAYMKSGRPIIGAVNGECARLIALAGVGATVAAGDSAGLAKLILKFSEMRPDVRAAMGAAGKKYFDAHYDADRCVSMLMKLMHERVRCVES